jgi:hypothetical protein
LQRASHGRSQDEPLELRGNLVEFDPASDKDVVAALKAGILHQKFATN